MIHLPTISVGPRDRGRSYGVLEHSFPAEVFQRFQPILEDFSLALAGWADLNLERFTALVPLDAERSAWVLWRAAHLGVGDLGTVARANGVLISAETLERLEGKAHRLLSALPPPTEADFGSEALASTPAAPTATSLPAFGLEWRDQALCLLDEADPEALLLAALEGVTPAAQIARIDGWASTGTLSASGGFDPAEAFRLIVRPPHEPRSPGPWREVEVRDGRILSPPEPAPAVWRAWRAVDQARASTASLPAAEWKPAWLTQTPDRPASLALLQAAAGLSPDARLDLIAAALSESRSDADLTKPMGQAAAQALLRLAASADSEGDGARYVEAGVTEPRFGPETAQALSAQLPLAGAPHLSKPSLERLLSNGFMARLTEPEAASAVAAYPAETQMSLLGESLRRAEAAPPARALAVRLIRSLASGEALARRYAAAGVSTLGDMAPSLVDAGLATRAVADVVREHPRIDAGHYAARAIQPVLRGEVGADPDAYLDALSAATRLLEPAE